MTRSAAPFVTLDGQSIAESTAAELRQRPDVSRVRIAGLSWQLGVLASLPALRKLDLTDPRTLEGLEQLQQLESLTLYALPHVTSFAPVGKLSNLKSLLISTPPGYDASRKCYEVDTLEPLAELTRLESLTMRGIVPREGRLDPIRRITSLLRLDISHVYVFGVSDYARLALALPHAAGHCLQPVFDAHWTGVCSRCGRRRVAFTAPPPRTARTACPVCHRARIDRHVAGWNAVTAAP